jgi:hypothetical protein
MKCVFHPASVRTLLIVLAVALFALAARHITEQP